MKIVFRKKFLKELAKIPSKTRKQIEKFVFEELPKLDSIDQINRLERMKGYPGYYKLRFGSYRVGIKIENDIIILEKALHRKDMIYIVLFLNNSIKYLTLNFPLSIHNIEKYETFN